MKITVLLEYFERQKGQDNSETYTLFCDFATIDDARTLYSHVTKQEIGQDQIQSLPTGVHIIGVKGKRRFAEDTYYEIDVDAAGVTVDRNPDLTTVYNSYTIDFGGASLEITKNAINSVPYTVVESKLEKAASTMETKGLVKLLGSIAEAGKGEDEYVRVKNIGQGNWNEYHIGDRIPLVFDLGTWMNASNLKARSLVDENSPKYASSATKPIVILSHWDLDHYRCLLEMKPKEIGYFGAFVVVETLPTATAQKAYDLIKKAPKVKIVAIPTYGKSKSKIPVMFKDCIQSSKVSIYPGVGSNRNSKGLIAVVKNKKTAVLLTGDCLWSQLNHVMRNEAKASNELECHLVVPHHGSSKDDLYYGFVIPCCWKYGIAAISVGKGNRYHHPNRSLLAYIKELYGIKKAIDRTDKLQADIDLKM